jgi:hypothetical protein
MANENSGIELTRAAIADLFSVEIERRIDQNARRIQQSASIPVSPLGYENYVQVGTTLYVRLGKTATALPVGFEHVKGEGFGVLTNVRVADIGDLIISVAHTSDYPGILERGFAGEGFMSLFMHGHRPLDDYESALALDWAVSGDPSAATEDLCSMNANEAMIIATGLARFASSHADLGLAFARIEAAERIPPSLW